MARLKRDVALFEVLAEEEAKGADPLRVPAWWGRRRKKPQRTAPEPPPPPPRRSEDAAVGDTRDAEDERPSIVELHNDTIRVSLTSVTAAVAVFAALVVILGAFELGQRMGHRAGFREGAAAGRAAYEAEALSEIEIARQQPPARDVVSDLLAQAEPVTPSSDERWAAERPAPTRRENVGSAERPGWVQDYTYVVAQEFARGHMEDALQAQSFLRQHGVDTDLVEYPSGSIQLITVQGYNRDDPVQRKMADELLRKVRTIGAKYFDSGGRYKLEGYFKTLKNDTWVDED